MWGEKWGEMIWGNPNAIIPVAIPIDGVWLFILGIIIGASASAIMARGNNWARLTSLSIILLLPVVAVFAVNLPHTFTNGTVADADEVNANFEALANNSNSNTYKVSIPTSTIPSDERYTALDSGRLSNLCADDDGCSLRLCVTSATGLISSCRTGHFLIKGDPKFYSYIDYYDISIGAVGASHTSSEQEIMVASNCTFTDADRYVERGTVPFVDDGIGFGLKYNFEDAPIDFCTIVFHD